MKTILTTVPKMYADWMGIGWTLLLGKSPTGPAIDPKRNSARAAAERGRADKGVSVKPAKMARAKPAAKKSSAKPAAKKSSAKPATRKSSTKPAAKKSSAKPAARKSSTKSVAKKSSTKSAAKKSSAKKRRVSGKRR